MTYLYAGLKSAMNAFPARRNMPVPNHPIKRQKNHENTQKMGKVIQKHL